MSKEQDLINVIVPVYNVEKYMNNCLDSIITQTYKNIEIILVDDGSQDKSGNICDEYAQKDSRIRVIHKKNGGLSDARNVGIDNAKGKYITFIDSDDYICETYIEELYNAIKKNNVKMSQCNIIKINNQKEIIDKIGYKDNMIKTGREMIKGLYKENIIENVVVWNKLYEKTLFDDIRFPVGKIHEDEFVTYKILYKLEKIAIINKYLYNYRQDNSSIMGKKYNVKRLDSLEAFEERLIFFQERNETELYNDTFKYYMSMLRGSYIKTRKYIENSEEIQKRLLSKYRRNFSKCMKLSDFKIKDRIKIIIFYMMPNIWYELKRNKY